MASDKSKIIGTLVPISALISNKVSKSDQGTFACAEIFLNWLTKTGQKGWQMLPLHQSQLEKGSSKHVPSPYKGYGIGLDPKYLRVSKVSKVSKALEKFVSENSYWIKEYALFCAIRDYYGTDDWREWEVGLRNRGKKDLNKWEGKLREEVEKHIFVQWQLHDEFEKIRKKAKSQEISLIGDLPFYLSIKSPLVWANQHLFEFDKKGVMKKVSGIPESIFGRQVWGHPLYKWEDKKVRREIVKLWKIRLKYCSFLFDFLRLDYAKGFFDYGVINLKSKEKDYYIEGPGEEVFSEIARFCKKIGLSIFAEDTGNNLRGLRKSMQKHKVPGIKILRFWFSEKKEEVNKDYANIPEYPRSCVAYTTTQDTETLLSYLNNLKTSQKKRMSEAIGVRYSKNDKILAKALVKMVCASNANLVIITIQDWLMLNERMNIPGTEKEVGDKNWKFKLKTPIEKLPLV